jgi:hypothetical protein
MSTARLQLRHVTISEEVELVELEDGHVFVPSNDPPPVRTLVSEHDGEAVTRALEVVRVVEVPESDARGERGFYAIPVELERLQEQSKVGTEHLDGGETPPSVEESMTLGAPAPVMDPDDSIPIDSRERSMLEENAPEQIVTDPEREPEPEQNEGEGEGESAEPQEQVSKSSDESSSASGEIGGGSGRKKRRGRKRR